NRLISTPKQAGNGSKRVPPSQRKQSTDTFHIRYINMSSSISKCDRLIATARQGKFSAGELDNLASLIFAHHEQPFPDRDQFEHLCTDEATNNRRTFTASSLLRLLQNDGTLYDKIPRLNVRIAQLIDSVVPHGLLKSLKVEKKSQTFEK